MKESIQVAKTVEEAVANALKKLDLTHDQVEIEILQEPKKGFLGIGVRDAHVHVKEKLILVEPEIEEVENDEVHPQTVDNPVEKEDIQIKHDDTRAIEEAKTYIESIVKQMDIHDLQMDVIQKQKTIHIQLSSEKAALLIGKRGQTLNSLQLVSQLVVQKYTTRYLTLELDVENYRQKRREALIELAHRLADQAVSTGKRIDLEPMPSSERKIIHHSLARRLDVDTFSEGDANRRHLVIEPIRS